MAVDLIAFSESVSYMMNKYCPFYGSNESFQRPKSLEELMSVSVDCVERDLMINV